MIILTQSLLKSSVAGTAERISKWGAERRREFVGGSGGTPPPENFEI